ncbi:MAG: hypothetical protein L3J56_00510 [Bacteroidales bacterium]|nr:hypothetical protein [Bacteroidales bacterium]
MDNLERNTTDIVGMSDFNQNLNGQDIETEAAVLAYIQKTRNVIAEKPDMFEIQQNASQMLQMFDYLLANWHQNRFEAIRVLAEKERHLLQQGFISYDASDLNISDVAENSGFFSALAELYEDEISELDGLFSRIKERRTERKEKRTARREDRKSKTPKERFKGFISKINKFNPVTLAVRNALRGVLALNFLGVSTILMKNEVRSKQVLEKVKNMYKAMGGKEDKLLQTLNKAKNRKALFNKKMQQELEAGKFKGIEGLGEPFSISGMLVAAGAFFLKIWNWIKEKGIKIKETVTKILPEKKDTQNNNPENSSYNLPGKTNDNEVFKTSNTTDSDKKNKWKKPLIAVGVLAGIFGIGYGVYNHNNKQKEEKKVIIEKETKLGDIAFQ